MPYNMWFLTPDPKPAPAGEWIKFVKEVSEETDGEQQAELTVGTPDDWRQISVTYLDGSWSFDFERRTVSAEGGEWADDLDFFRGNLDGVEPAVNAQWIAQYLTRVRMVYTFRCSINAPDSNLEMVREIVESLGEDEHSGLLYAELEGWSNEGGQQITWEFSDRVSGLWWMALRSDSGWKMFQMERRNPDHRKAFRAGEVPAGVQVTEYRD